ncbi:MAG: DUF6642 family protein [Nocardioides sp.]|uniref:DUF6642 family protein n=1 Tax=Nocardioides sp. TaxID=35761 RepID=UPI003F04EFA0
MAAKGIFCIEGEWSPDMRERSSVLPLLELLETRGVLTYVHRTAATQNEVAHHLHRWSLELAHEYQVLYLATHGEPGILLWSGRETTSFDELAQFVGDIRGTYVYLGSCLTLLDTDQGQRFLRGTGAEAILGYRREVDWIEASAFEVVLLPTLAAHEGTPAELFEQLVERFAGIVAEFELVLATPTTTFHGADGVG